MDIFPQRYTNQEIISTPLDNSLISSDIVSYDLIPTLWDKGSTIDFFIESSKDGVNWNTEVIALNGDPGTITKPYTLKTWGPTIDTAILPKFLRCRIIIKGRITFSINEKLGDTVII